MKVPAFLGGGLSGLQNVFAWAVAAGLAYAWHRRGLADSGALMTAAERDAFNARRKAEADAAAAATAPPALAAAGGGSEGASGGASGGDGGARLA